MEKAVDNTFAEGESVLTLNGLTLPNIDDATMLSPTSSGYPIPTGALRSPSSPSQKSPQCCKGKSMKEIENDLDAFRRENFDLKMRLYVMEEQMVLFENKEALLQKYEELKMLQAENEKLLIEVKEKNDLVLKAGEAVTLLKQKHVDDMRRLAENYERQIKELKEKVAELQDSLASKEDSPLLSNLQSALQESTLEDSLQIPFDSTTNQTYSAVVNNLEQQVQELQLQLEKNNKCMSEYEILMDGLKEELKEARIAAKNLEEEVKNKTQTTDRLFAEIREKESSVCALSKKNYALIERIQLQELQVDSLTKQLDSYKTHDIALTAVALQDADSITGENRQSMEASSFNSSSLIVKEMDKLHEALVAKDVDLEQIRADYSKSLQASHELMKVNKALATDNEVLRQKIDALKARRLATTVRTVDEKANLAESSVTESAQIDLDDGLLDEDDSAAKIGGLEEEVTELRLQLAAVTAVKNQFENDVEVKVKEIEHLNEELRKRTTNLQGLVNMELWDKNKEIEKLNLVCEKKQAEVVNLNRKLAEQRVELNALNSKVQELSDSVRLDVSELKNQLDDACRTKSELENECTRWKTEVELSEKIQKELVNACILLKNRLEELASFLESLLRVPCLGAKRRQLLQTAIDRSREVSQRLSLPGVQVDISIPILPDLSQVDFFSEDDLTVHESKNSPEASNAEISTASFGSHPKSLSIDRLDMCLAYLSKDVNLEDVTEGSLPVSFSDSASYPASRKNSAQLRPLPQQPPAKSSSQPPLLSETEEWSEPDRNVSLARIGIKDVSVVRPPSTDDSTDRSCNRSVSSTSKKNKKVDGKRRLIRNKSVERKSSSRSPDKLILADNLQATGDFISSSPTIKIQEMAEGKQDLESSLKMNRELLKKISESFDDGDLNKKELLLLHTIAAQLEKLCGLCTYLEGRCGVLEKEKEDLTVKLNQRDEKIDSLTKERTSLQTELKEKENEALEKHCMLLELKLDREAKNLEKTVEELDGRLKESEDKLKKSNEKEEELLNEKIRLEVMVQERQKAIVELQRALEKAFKKIQELSKSRMYMETEWKQKLDCLTKEKNEEVESEVVKRKDLERKLVECYEAQAELQKVLDIEMTKTRQIEMTQKTSERWWRRRAEELETSSAEREAELRRRLDAAALATSQAILERTRLANDKIRLQCEIRRRDDTAHEVKLELEKRVKELEEANREMSKKVTPFYQHHCRQFPVQPPSLSDPETTSVSNRQFSRQRSNPTSDYTSDPDQHGSNGNVWFTVSGRNNNCSPDLGIESDQGKMSSLDPIPSSKSQGDLGQLEKENADLRSQLTRLRKQLRETTSQLNEANKQKHEVEKAITHQLGKTHNILRKARLNLETPESQPSRSVR